MTRWITALGLLALAAACEVPRGDQQHGEPCGDDRECEHGLCVAGVRGDAPVCTISCARDTECPRGWSCHGVTQAQVLVCAFGGSTPFDPNAERR